MIVEVCANSLQSALNAEKAGADRIELCAELGVGGITPSYGLIKKVRESLSIPIHVLIRPRSGDFTYSHTEFAIMKEDITKCVDMGCDGIVAGILHKDFTLDVIRTRELMASAGDLKFTFHRAFDWVKNPMETLSQLEAIGTDYILTSGQEKSALDGMPLLMSLHQKATNCIIIPGGGVRENNVLQFKKKGFAALHLSGIKIQQTLTQPPAISMNTLSFLEEDKIAVTDPQIIQKVSKTVK